MLNAVIIILREVLEASLLTSVLLAISQTLGLSRKWILSALGLGMLGAGFFASFYDVISDGLEGRGQEVSNSVMLLMVVTFLTMICVWATKYQKQKRFKDIDLGTLKWLVIATVSIATIREGAEILLYASVFSDSMDSFLPIFVGGSLGAGIGISIGALVYYLLVSLPKKAWLRLTLAILSLVAAGMSAQIGLNLMQVGWLPSQLPVWNTSRFLPETSLIGQLLYATLGYESSPSAIQLGFYVLPLLSVFFSVLLTRRAGNGKERPLDADAREGL